MVQRFSIQVRPLASRDTDIWLPRDSDEVVSIQVRSPASGDFHDCGSNRRISFVSIQVSSLASRDMALNTAAIVTGFLFPFR